MELRLKIEVPVGEAFAKVLTRAVGQVGLDNAQNVVAVSCGESYFIYRGGCHIAIHEKVGAGVGPRIASIYESY